jgi:acetyl-CoA acetyltransferase
MFSFAELKNRVAIIGVGNTAYGSFPKTDEYSLGAEAFGRAVDDCGISKSQIDGLLTCRVPDYTRMGEVLGIDPRWTLTLPGHGRMSAMAIIEAALALVTGRAKYVALIYTNIGRSRRMKYGGDEFPGFWDPWGFTSPGAANALMFRRHMALYGTTTRQLAEVSVAFRYHAGLNPGAVMRNSITIEDHENAPLIVAPLRLLDYCLINDGAISLIMTTADRAKDFRQPPVLIAGVGAQDNFRNSSIPIFGIDFWYDSLRKAGDESYAMAGIDRSDVDALMCYDHFSPAALFALEGLGYCPRGEAGPFVEGGALKLGGKLPMNTDGGHLSNSYMQGWALNIEAVRQLRGECGERQIPKCEVAQFIIGSACTRSIIYTKG